MSRTSDSGARSKGEPDALQTPCGSGASEAERHWFVRPWPRWWLLSLAVLVALGMGVGLPSALAARELLVELGLLEQLRSTFGESAILGTLSMIYLLGGVAGGCVWFCWIHRRCGVCLLSPDVLTIDLGVRQPEAMPALDGDAGTRIPLNSVRGWQRTHYGLLLTVPGRGWVKRLLLPVFLPLHGPEDQALAERLLRARAAASTPPTTSTRDEPARATDRSP